MSEAFAQTCMESKRAMVHEGAAPSTVSGAVDLADVAEDGPPVTRGMSVGEPCCWRISARVRTVVPEA